MALTGACSVCGRHHEGRADCPDRPFDPGPPVPIKKRFVRVVTKQGAHFDMDEPADFNMINFIMSIKAGGCILNDFMFQPLEEIATIFRWTSDAKPPGESVVVPFKPVL